MKIPKLLSFRCNLKRMLSFEILNFKTQLVYLMLMRPDRVFIDFLLGLELVDLEVLLVHLCGDEGVFVEFSGVFGL